MTVIRQSKKPRYPTMARAEMKQHPMGSVIHRPILKKNHRTTIMTISTPQPNMEISLLIKSIMSELIMATPPRKQLPLILDICP